MKFCVTVIAGGLALVLGSAAWGETCQPLSVAPTSIPAAVEGRSYSHAIPTYGGKGSVSVAVTEGGLPPRMTMAENGTLSGSPSASGTFTFTVTATDSCQPRQQASQRLTLDVLPPGSDPSSVSGSVMIRTPIKVGISVTPKIFALPTVGETRIGVTYQLKAEPAATAVLDSPGGTFSAAGTVLGSMPAPLTAVLVNGVGTIEESIVIPRNVVEQAQYDGAATLIFSRPFMGHGTTALAVIEIGIPQKPKPVGKGQR